MLSILSFEFIVVIVVDQFSFMVNFHGTANESVDLSKRMRCFSVLYHAKEMDQDDMKQKELMTKNWNGKGNQLTKCKDVLQVCVLKLH